MCIPPFESPNKGLSIEEAVAKLFSAMPSKSMGKTIPSGIPSAFSVLKPSVASSDATTAPFSHPTEPWPTFWPTSWPPAGSAPNTTQSPVQTPSRTLTANSTYNGIFGGALAGIVVGVIVGFALSVVGAAYIVVWKRPKAIINSAAAVSKYAEDFVPVPAIREVSELEVQAQEFGDQEKPVEMEAAPAELPVNVT